MTTFAKKEPRPIVATFNVHSIEFTGNCYSVRHEIMSKGGVYFPDKQTWRVAPRTPSLDQWACSLSVQQVYTQDLQAQQAQQAQATRKEPDTMPADSSDILQEPATPRRRISRAADAEKQPAQDPATQDQSEALLKAMAAFVAANQVKQEQPKQDPPTLDLTQVQTMIDDALKSVKATRVDITAAGSIVRSVDGLHHYMLADLIKCVSTGMNVWLSGPSQAGKTTAAKQVAKALGLAYYAHGSINMAHELLGFVDAGGTYRETQFVKAYRNGGLVLLDEVDRGTNEGCLAMQMALANGEMPLPDGTMLKRHPDFRCIAAANTWGGGATSDYVGAARLDAAFLQRFPVKLHWQYDEALETQLTANTEWAARVQQARAKVILNGLKVLITPQATIAGAALISAGYTPDQAAGMTYQAGLSPDQCRMIG